MVNNPSMEKVSVIGTGTMGHSISLGLALSHLEVTMIGIDDADIKKGINSIDEKINILIQNDIIPIEEKKRIQQNIITSTNKADIKNMSFIIEAAPENLEFKQELYKELESYCSFDTIIASNTSSLKPSDISKCMKNPERMVVTHFWNPAHLLPLVEVVKNQNTSENTIERTMKLMEYIGKYPIRVEKEILGFVGNRLQYALFREAQFLLEEGVATVEDIDTAVQMSIGRRLAVTGPFLTADMGGLDVFKSISDYIFPDLAINKQPLLNLEEKVKSGSYGQKNGKGYYNWDEHFHEKLNNEREQELIRWYREDREK